MIGREKIGAYVGLDVHKDQIAVAIADASRAGEVRYWGQIESSDIPLRRLMTGRIAQKLTHPSLKN